VTHDHDLVLCPTAAQKAAALAPPPGRTGGDLVVETLRGLGVTTVFGAVGGAGSPLDDAVRRSGLTAWDGFATPAGAGHAADGFGRLSGEAAALLASEGPGPAVLREALAASAPLLVLATRPVAGQGVKVDFTARTPSQIPTAVAEAWEAALTAPHGPVWVELDPAALAAVTVLPEVNAPDVLPHELPPRPELTALAAHWLETAARPLIVTGGGATRADAAGKVKALAGRLHAHVATTRGGAGAFPGAPEVTPALLESADVLLLVGTTLEGVRFAPPARLIQIDADPSRLEAHHAPALGIHADARLALTALLETVAVREGEWSLPVAPEPATDPLLAVLRQVLPPRTPTFWDRPPTGFQPRHPNTFHAPQAAGTTGYALPAALGAATADPGAPVLAVSDAASAAAVLPELAAVGAAGLPLVWLIRGEGTGDECVAAAEAASVAVVRAELDVLAEELAKALVRQGPVVVVAVG
jgi:acetolactate synthase-1/2/3 large subunit